MLSDHRVQRSDASADGTRVRFAGRVPDQEGVLADGPSPALAEMLGGGDYLTTIDQTFTDPGPRVVSDFTFERAEDVELVERYTVVEDVRVLGIHAGPLLVGAGLLLGAGVVALVVRRHRAR